MRQSYTEIRFTMIVHGKKYVRRLNPAILKMRISTKVKDDAFLVLCKSTVGSRLDNSSF